VTCRRSFFNYRGPWAGLQSRFLFKISPYDTRRPANIPLHTLSSSTRLRDADSARLLDDHDRHSDRSSFDDTPSEESDLSLWTDTGDLVDQLADQEDPLRIRLQESYEDTRPPKHRRQQKRVHYLSQDDIREKPGRGALRKEDIEIPDPGTRSISKAHRILAAVMAPRDGPSRMERS
jgi:hypothetical protein